MGAQRLNLTTQVRWMFPVLLLPVLCLAQQEYMSPSKIYSFKIPAGYKSQPSNHERNEFVFVSPSDTTSLVINVNSRVMDEKNLRSFKKATNAEIESRYFVTVTNPKIIKRGDIDTYQSQSIYFHITHATGSDLENDYMMTYLFFHKGKEINFIFRTKAYRLPSIMKKVEEIVHSVKLL
jgi:hypothetical protein